MEKPRHLFDKIQSRQNQLMRRENMRSNESIGSSNPRDKKLSVKLSASTLGRCLIPDMDGFFENGPLEPVSNYKLQGAQSSRVKVKLKLKL